MYPAIEVQPRSGPFRGGEFHGPFRWWICLGKGVCTLAWKKQPHGLRSKSCPPRLPPHIGARRHRGNNRNSHHASKHANIDAATANDNDTSCDVSNRALADARNCAQRLPPGRGGHTPERPAHEHRNECDRPLKRMSAVSAFRAKDCLWHVAPPKSRLGRLTIEHSSLCACFEIPCQRAHPGVSHALACSQPGRGALLELLELAPAVPNPSTKHSSSKPSSECCSHNFCMHNIADSLWPYKSHDRLNSFKGGCLAPQLPLNVFLQM